MGKLNELKWAKYLKRKQSYTFLLLSVNVRPMGDVNKEVWPNKFRRSNDVTKHSSKKKRGKKH